MVETSRVARVKNMEMLKMMETNPFNTGRPAKSCRCCGTRSPFRVLLNGEKSADEGILRYFKEYTGIYEISTNAYLCRICVKKVLHIKKKITELKVMCQSCRETFNVFPCQNKRSLQETNPDRSILPEKTMVLSLPKRGESCFISKFRRISPKPLTADLLHVESTASQPFASTTVTNLPTTNANAPRKLPKFLQSEKDEEADVLASFGLHAKVKYDQVDQDLNLTSDEREFLRCEAVKGSVPAFVEALMKLPEVKKCLQAFFLKEIDNQCQKLCVRTRGQPSVLRTSKDDQKNLSSSFSWVKIMNEMRDRAPDVLDFLVTVAAPKHKESGKQIPPICEAYAILMNVRCRELSLVQKINTIVLSTGGATKKTFERFNKLGISQTRGSLLNFMDDIGQCNVSEIQRLVATEGNLRIVFDNFDFRVLSNVSLPTRKNADMHWIAQFATFDRIPSNHLDDTKSLVASIDDFENKEYLLSNEELEKLKSDFTVLVARVLVQFFPCLEYLKDDVCAHIPHRFSQQMAKKSVIMELPILPFNQNKHGDVCQYLDYLENLLMEVFNPNNQAPAPQPDLSPADLARRRDEVLRNVNVPLCGDLLGRERVTGAKKTRMGCDFKTEKFENIVENVAQWHAKQSFLGYAWEQLYKASPTCGREVGTLYNLRQQFQMFNVYSDVKKNYKSAELLMLSATKSYLCCAFMQWTGMDSLKGTPNNIKLPSTTSNKEEKAKFLNATIGKFVEEYVLVELTQSLSSHRQPSSNTSTPQTQFLADQIVIMVQPKTSTPGGYDVFGVGQVVELEKSSSLSRDVVPVHVAAIEEIAAATLVVGQVVLWPKKFLATPSQGQQGQNHQQKSSDSQSSNFTSSSHQADRLLNYASQCLQLGVLLMQLNDTEKEGDGDRCLMNWKLLMLYFRSRPRGMKYAFEAMRLITCVKALFTEKLAHRIIHGQFVNLRGGPGNNIANDLRMEMKIKDDKGMLRRMCGNKTLKAVNRSTSSTYGFKLASDAIDKESGVHPDSTRHTHQCTRETVEEMINILHERKPFQYKEGRTLKSFPDISRSPLDQLDVIALHAWLTKHKRRLATNAFERCDDDEDNDDDNDEDEDDNNDIIADDDNNDDDDDDDDVGDADYDDHGNDENLHN